MVRIRSIRLLGGFTVELGLTDGAKRVVDLERYLRGPMFEPLRNDPALFASVRVDPELGTVVWPNGADLDPEVLIHDRRPVGWDGSG
jgi:Protein of unknown function (DUF2442)